MQQNGWVKLHKKITQWEWFTDSKTLHVFINLLLTANNEIKEWRGITVNRGQRLATQEELCKETGLTRQNLRTALKHLVLTKELTINLTNNQPRNFGLYTVLKYDDYQQPNHQLTKQSTSTKEDKKKRRKEFIYITDGEMEKLTGVLGPHLEDYLTRLDLYIGSHGDKYKNHYYTLLTWYRKDHPSSDSAAPPPPKTEWQKRFEAAVQSANQENNELDKQTDTAI